jgi:hypothetical protein
VLPSEAAAFTYERGVANGGTLPDSRVSVRPEYLLYLAYAYTVPVATSMYYNLESSAPQLLSGGQWLDLLTPLANPFIARFHLSWLGLSGIERLPKRGTRGGFRGFIDGSMQLSP